MSLRENVEARQEMRRRTDGCIKHGFRDLWMGNPCFYFRLFTKMKKHGIKARKSFDGSIQEMAVLNRFEGLHCGSLRLGPQKHRFRHSSCRITYIMRHGFR